MLRGKQVKTQPVDDLHMSVFAYTATKNIYIAWENVSKYSIKVEPLGEASGKPSGSLF